MKLYIQDRGVFGSIVAVAHSEKEARELMADQHNYDADARVQEHEIRAGFVFANLGDS